MKNELIRAKVKRTNTVRGLFRAVEEPHELGNVMWIKVQHINYSEQFNIVFLDWWGRI